MATNAIESIGVSLGAGTCRIMNAFRTMSDEYEDYYEKKENKGILDHVFNAANSLGRGGVKLVAGIGRTASSIAKSEPVQGIKSGIANAYDKLREKYTGYLTKTSERLKDEMESGEAIGIGTRFKSFATSTLKVIDSAYQKGEGFVKSTAKTVSNIGKGVKGSEAYHELTAINKAAGEKAQRETEVENTLDQEKD